MIVMTLKMCPTILSDFLIALMNLISAFQSFWLMNRLYYQIRRQCLADQFFYFHSIIQTLVIKYNTFCILVFILITGISF